MGTWTGLRWGGTGRLTEHRELGGAGAHGASLVPSLAVVLPCLVLAKPPQLQVRPRPMLAPVQQGPVVEPEEGSKWGWADCLCH